MKNKQLISFSIILLVIFLSTSVNALFECDDTVAVIWNVGSATASKSEVSAGGIVSITVPITNNAQNTDYTCSINIGGSSTSKQVQPGRTEELTLQVTAPSSETTSQKTETVNVQVECSGIWDRIWPLEDCEVHGEVIRTTSYKWPTQAEILEKQAQTAADSAKTSASNAISDANSAINSAKNRINEASKIGADVSSATQYLNSAESDYSSASTLLSSGNSAYSSKDYNSAKLYYQQTQSKADSAKSSATSAKSMVDKIVEEYNKKKTEAQNKVSDANSAIDTAKQRINAADKVISDATIIGLDTAQAKADIATARSKIDTAEDYYKEASNLFSVGNFDGSKSKAQSAINLANQAESLATTAYNKLHERLTVAGESSKAILNANSEVSQMNEILTKMDYIIRSVKKWGVNLAETEGVVNTAKTNVDSAEDLLSQAKNRQASGSFDSAVNSANQARDKAASSRNRLDTMTHTISLSTQDGLEKAIVNIEFKIDQAEQEVNSAAGTYGATPEYIVSAQKSLSSAKRYLTEAKSYSQKVPEASGLTDLLKEAEASFKALDEAESKANLAFNDAKSAKLGLTKKVAIGTAIAVAAGGGGFLYYRSRKRKGKKKKDKKKEKKKEAKKEKKKRGGKKK